MEGKKMQIDRDVPTPTERPKGKKDMPPVQHMAVGDGIFFDGDNRQTAMGKCRIAAIYTGVRFNFCSASEGTGSRVWRTA